MANQHPLYTQLITSLTAIHLPPNKPWLASFLSQTSQNSNRNLQSLLQTTRTHILSSNITTTLNQSTILPADISSASISHRTLTNDIPVQILDLVDIGRSTWTQLQDLEMDARGERVVGRNAIVRIAEDDPGITNPDGLADDFSADPGPGPGGINTSNRSSGPWKVLLQDAAGSLVWAFDGEGVLSGTGSGQGDGKMPAIGCKVLLRRGCVVARGTVLLERQHVMVLGGAIEEMDKMWMAGRIERLKAKLQERT